MKCIYIVEQITTRRVYWFKCKLNIRLIALNLTKIEVPRARHVDRIRTERVRVNISDRPTQFAHRRLEVFVKNVSRVRRIRENTTVEMKLCQIHDRRVKRLELVKIYV